jgi:phosphoglycerate kinase
VKLPSIASLDLAGKRVLIRADLNVPLDGSGRISDDTRIRASLPTIRLAIEKGARVLVASHLGRPKGKVNPRLSLRPVAERLADLLRQKVRLAPDCVGNEVETLVAGLAPQELLLLENLRFHPEEEKNDPAFAGALARLADVWVNDAFGAAHRAHASTSGIGACIGEKAGGLLLLREADQLSRMRADAPSPFVVVIGGAKVRDKLGVLRKFLGRADRLLIGGAMAYTFLAAAGKRMGNSRVEEDRRDDARTLLGNDAGATGILLPRDHVVARELSPGAESKPSPTADIEEGWLGVDIGPATVVAYEAEIARARTIFWNGPMGVFEMPPWDGGTLAVARAVAGATDRGATSVVGGGDSAAAIRAAGLSERITHVSTGGGASLEFIQGVDLPGLAALR